MNMPAIDKHNTLKQQEKVAIIKKFKNFNKKSYQQEWLLLWDIHQTRDMTQDKGEDLDSWRYSLLYYNFHCQQSNILKSMIIIISVITQWSWCFKQSDWFAISE